MNSSIRVAALVEDFAGPDAERIVSPHPRPGVLLDCTDNFETRYLINDVAVKLGIPYVYGGAVGASGMNLAVIPGVTPCLRCLFPDPPSPGSAPTCDTAGILGPVAAAVGAMQALDALKILIGRADRLDTSLRSFDGWTNTKRHVNIGPTGRDPNCPCCSRRQFDFLTARPAAPRVLCGRNSVQIAPPNRLEINLTALAQRLANAGDFALTPHHLRGRLAGELRDLELTIFPDGRAIIAGTTDPVEARTLYARYIGS